MLVWSEQAPKHCYKWCFPCFCFFLIWTSSVDFKSKMRSASMSRKVLVKRYWFGPVVMALPARPNSIASLARRTSMRFLGWSKMQIFCLILVMCSLLWSERTNSSQISPSWEDDCTSFSINSSRLMGADVPDLFLSMSWLGRADLTCSLCMMLVMEGTRTE